MAFNSTAKNSSQNISVDLSGISDPYQISIKDENRIILCIICLIIVIFGVTGNVTVCCVLGRKKLRRNGDVFILSLAMVDLISCSTGPSITGFFFAGLKVYGFFHKALWFAAAYVINTSLAISSFVLVTIAADRFWAIKKPFAARRITKRKKAIVNLCVWIAGCAWSGISVSVSNKLPPSTGANILQLCWMAVTWMIPFILMTMLYIMCIHALWSRKRTCISFSLTERRLKETLRITKMFSAIILTFLVCVIPLLIASVVHAIESIFESRDALKEGKRNNFWLYILGALFYLHGCLNPFIYAKVHPDIKDFVKSFIRRIGFSKARKQQLQTSANNVEQTNSR